MINNVKFYKIALCGRLDWRNGTCYPASRTTEFVRMIESVSSNLKIAAVDWRSISEEGTIDLFDTRTLERRRVPLECFDLIHVYSVGRFSQCETPLRWKWSQFVQRLDILDRYNLRCANPTITLRSAISKNYLLDLGRKGLPIIPTSRVSSSIGFREFKEICGDTVYVVKPDNGECGRFLMFSDQVTELDLQIFARETDHIILQPFNIHALTGEKSLIFLGSKFSHSVLKIPVTWTLQGRVVRSVHKILRYKPTAYELELAGAAARAFSYPVDSYRVDFIGNGSTLAIMEFEAVDPGHFANLNMDYINRLHNFYVEISKQ